MEFFNTETRQLVRRTPKYRVKEITAVIEKVTEQLSALHNNLHEKRLSLLPTPPKFIEKFLSPKPIERFGLVHTAAQHFDQAFFTLQEHPLGKPASIWLAKQKSKSEEELDESEELETHVLDVLGKSVILLEYCNRAIVKDVAWMSNQLRGNPGNEEEAGTAKVFNKSQQEELASELDRKTYTLRHIVYRLIAMNGSAADDAHGPVPGRAEKGLLESVSEMFADSTEKFSKCVAEATASSTKEMVWSSRKGKIKLRSKENQQK